MTVDVVQRDWKARQYLARIRRRRAIVETLAVVAVLAATTAAATWLVWLMFQIL